MDCVAINHTMTRRYRRSLLRSRLRPLCLALGGVMLAVLIQPSVVRGDIAGITGVYDVSFVRFDVTFTEPAPIDGGWQFQLFVDDDGDDATGYGPGFDKLVRGVEGVERGWVFLRQAEGGTGPGGWGDAIGDKPTVRVHMIDDWNLEFEIPVGRDGVRAGRFRFTFESYFDDRLQDAVRLRQTVSGDPDRVDVGGDAPPPDMNGPDTTVDDPTDVDVDVDPPSDSADSSSPRSGWPGLCGSFASGTTFGLIATFLGLIRFSGHRDLAERCL